MRKPILTIITICLSLILADGGFSWAVSDKTDKIAGNNAAIFSPGYINVTKQKTEAIMGQAEKKRGLIGSLAGAAVDLLKDIVFLGNNDESQDHKLVPELQRKTSIETIAVDGSPHANIIYGTQDSIDIGSGQEDGKQYDRNGRMVSEIIDGIRNIYAGFDNVGVGTISDAIGMAMAGDRVIIKSGTYNERVYVQDGVSIFGGYGESGARDTERTPTILNSGIDAVNIWLSPTEINGFTINWPSGSESYGMHVSSSYFLTIRNNTFNKGGMLSYGIWIEYSSYIYIKDNKFTELNTVGVGTQGTSGIFVTNNDFNSFGIDALYNAGVESSYNNFNGGYAILSLYYSQVSSESDYFLYGNDSLQIWEGSISTSNSLNMSIQRASSTLLEITSTLGGSTDNQTYVTYYNKDLRAQDYEFTPFTVEIGQKPDSDELASSLKGLMYPHKKGIGPGNPGGVAEPDIVVLLKDVVMVSALSAPAGNVIGGNDEAMKLGKALESILDNPTSDQKLILDTLKAVIDEIQKVKTETGSNELDKPFDQLLEVAAAALLGQALPGLLKSEDMAGIKTIFSDLDSARARIMLDYKESTKPYYDEMIKLIEKNLAILKMKNIVSDDFVKEALTDLPRSEIDVILNKIRNDAHRAFEEDYILQQEKKLRKKYIDPNREFLEDNMKAMLKGFAKKLYFVLEGANVIKEKETAGK